MPKVNLHTDLRFYNNSLKNSELEVIINYILEEGNVLIIWSYIFFLFFGSHFYLFSRPRSNLSAPSCMCVISHI